MFEAQIRGLVLRRKSFLVFLFYVWSFSFFLPPSSSFSISNQRPRLSFFFNVFPLYVLYLSSIALSLFFSSLLSVSARIPDSFFLFLLRSPASISLFYFYFDFTRLFQTTSFHKHTFFNVLFVRISSILFAYVLVHVYRTHAIFTSFFHGLFPIGSFYS